MENVVGIIGGSGIYQLDILSDLKEQKLDTPFGTPSAAPMVGYAGKTKVVFIPRHGKGHTMLPTEVPYRANIYAMKQLGVRWLLSVSAVGSLKEEIKPGDMVLVDQFIDRTFHRPSTFFGEGLVGHVSFGDPVSKVMVESLTKACDSVKATYHKGGTYICMEGPQFSTRAESNLYRSWGASVIGMTNIQEAKLAREAEISFASLSMATDYDCWHEEEVNAQAVVATLMKNIATSKKILSAFLQNPPSGDCEHQHALKHALVTDKQMIPEATKKKLQLLVGKYL